MGYGGLFLRFMLILAQRVGGMGRALLLIVLWVTLCLALVLAGAWVGLSDPEVPLSGLAAVVIALAGALLLIAGPWLAKLWFDRGR